MDEGRKAKDNRQLREWPRGRGAGAAAVARTEGIDDDARDDGGHHHDHEEVVQHVEQPADPNVAAVGIGTVFVKLRRLA